MESKELRRKRGALITARRLLSENESLVQRAYLLRERNLSILFCETRVSKMRKFKCHTPVSFSVSSCIGSDTGMSRVENEIDLHGFSLTKHITS